MQNVELLAPAGSMDALIAAVVNGADAVYLGGVKFGARAYADNFNDEQMIKAIQYAHGYGVKVYVTMNTLLFEEEMDQAFAYARFLYEHGADALIIQDLGLFDLLHQSFPDLELHASTQMHIHNEAGIVMMRDAGMKRIVLPRETTIEEIRAYASLGVELEVFVQGALCVSYSGQCLMSAKKLGRSGNRGACAQMCRMKYRLGKTDKDGITYVDQDGMYLLSPKDLNTLHRIPELIEAGIASFKIEGRMKRSEYVAVMTACYRQAIDAYLHKKTFDEASAVMQMRKIFNRGFSEGYLFSNGGRSLMNPYRPNHMGIEIGEVVGKKGNRVRIRLCAPLRQYDGIRFLSEGEDVGCKVNKLYRKQLLVKEANKGDIVEIAMDAYLPKGTRVVKTSDYAQLEELHRNKDKSMRRIALTMDLYLHKEEMPRLKVYDDFEHHCEVKGSITAQQAMKTPISKERVIEQLAKCGDTIFYLKQVNCDMDEDVTISIGELNQLRRKALKQLYAKRIAIPQPRRMGKYHRELSFSPLRGIYVSVATLAQYEAAVHMGLTHIYANPSLYRQLKEKGTTIGYSGKRIMKEAYPDTAVMISEIGGITHPDAIAAHFVNVTNSYAAAFLFAHGVKGIVLSTECTQAHRRQLMHAFHKRYGMAGSFLLHGYGREELMVMEYCPINTCLSNQGKANCRLCRGESVYVLEDMHHHRYPLCGDEDCRMHIMDDTAQTTWEDAEAIVLRFYDETREQCEALIQHAAQYLKQGKDSI